MMSTNILGGTRMVTIILNLPKKNDGMKSMGAKIL